MERSKIKDRSFLKFQLARKPLKERRGTNQDLEGANLETKIWIKMERIFQVKMLRGSSPTAEND